MMRQVRLPIQQKTLYDFAQKIQDMRKYPLPRNRDYLSEHPSWSDIDRELEQDILREPFDDWLEMGTLQK
jgi:hypothetical protein